ERMVSDAERYGVQADTASIERFRLEIAENSEDLKVYLQRIDELREQVEVGRVQSGFGDERFEADDRARAEFIKLFSREVTLAAASSGKQAAYARSLAPLMSRITSVEGRLVSQRRQLDALAESQGNEMRQIVDTEAQAIEAYASKLDTMDQHARLLVGE